MMVHEIIESTKYDMKEKLFLIVIDTLEDPKFSMTELAKLLSCTKMTVANIIRKLEADGTLLVERNYNEDGGKAKSRYYIKSL
jgi:DNA-binding MarR family transcriptional regulator